MIIQQLKSAAITRDQYGFWSHPDWKNYIETSFNQSECLSESEIQQVHIHFNITTGHVYFESDATDELIARYYDQNDRTAVQDWIPSKPDHDRDWFIISIHESSNGDVVALWAKPYNTFLNIERPLFEKNYTECGGQLQFLRWEECSDGNGTYQPNWETFGYENSHEDDEGILEQAEHVTSCLSSWIECAKLKTAEIQALKAELAKAKNLGE